MGRPAKATQQRRVAAETSQLSRMESDRINVIERGMRKLKRPKGQPITREEAVLILNLYLNQIKRVNNYNKAIRETCGGLGLTRRAVVKVVQSFLTHGEIRVQRGEGTAAGGSLTANVKTHLGRIVSELNKAKGSTTIQEIRARLMTPPAASDDPDDPDKDRQPVKVTCTTVRRWLRLMGYRYTKSKKGFVVTERRKSRIREYLIDYSKAFKKQKDGTHVIVYTDESYVNVGHKVEKTWRQPGDKSEHSTGKGKRLIIVHAITKDGPLVLWEGAEWEKDPIREGWFKQVHGTGENTQSEGARAAADGAVAAAAAWKAAGGTTSGAPAMRSRSKAVRKAVVEAAQAAERAALGQEVGAGEPLVEGACMAGQGGGSHGGGGMVAGAPAAPAQGSGERQSGAASESREEGTNTPGRTGGGQSVGGGNADGTPVAPAEGGTEGSAGTTTETPGTRGPSGGSGSGGAVRAGGRFRKKTEKGEAAAAAAASSAAAKVGRAARGEDVVGGGGVPGSAKGKKRAAGKRKAEAVATSLGGAAGGAAAESSAHSRYAREKIVTEDTAEMVYPAGEKSAAADYHKNMDAATFLLWLQHRLVPAFKRRYGASMKMVLVMDNAAYHHGMPEGWTSPLHATKKTNLALLQKLQQAKEKQILDKVVTGHRDGVEQFKYGVNVTRNGKTVGFVMPEGEQQFSKKPAGPSQEELQQATYRILEQRAPELLMTRAEIFFKNNDLGELLFTPPYCPDLQPIELFWAYGKNYVAHNFIQGRLLPDVHQMLIEGLYGMGETATNKVVGKMVNRSNEFVNKYIAQDAILDGDVNNLLNVPDNYRVSKGGVILSTVRADDGVDDEVEGEDEMEEDAATGAQEGEAASGEEEGMEESDEEDTDSDDEEESDEEDTDSDDEDLEGDDEDIEKDGDEDDREGSSSGPAGDGRFGPTGRILKKTPRYN